MSRGVAIPDLRNGIVLLGLEISQAEQPALGLGYPAGEHGPGGADFNTHPLRGDSWRPAMCWGSDHWSFASFKVYSPGFNQNREEFTLDEWKV